MKYFFLFGVVILIIISFAVYANGSIIGQILGNGENPTIIIKDDAAERNCIISTIVNINALASAKKQALGIVTRYSDENNYYSFVFEGKKKLNEKIKGKLRIESRVYGKVIMLEQKDYIINLKEPCEFKVETNGNILTLLINNVEEISVESMSLPYGSAGFITYGVNSCFSEFNVKAALGIIKPDAKNTGPTDPTRLIDSSSITITKDYSIIENVNVKGYINIKANNVTIRNFKVTANAGTIYPVRIFKGYYNTVFEDGEIDGGSCALANIIGNNYIAKRLNVHSSGGDGFKGSYLSSIEGCWIHNLGLMKGAHADGIQISGGSNLKIIGNNFDMPIKVPNTLSNAAVFIKSDIMDIDTVLVDSNWMNGGNYTVYSVNHSKDKSPLYCTQNVKIVNNRIGRDYRYGIKSINNNTIWENNTWEDNGKPAN